MPQKAPHSNSYFLRSLLQKIFGEFVTVEMTFHAKALEVYTTAFQNIQMVDEDEDLEVSR